jgi:cytochrome b subunit of formate dehydrogenase
MNKRKINYIIDFPALISFVITAFTGLALMLFMPSGIRQGRFQSLWGIEKTTWIKLHDWSGLVLIILVIIHLILHWNWVVIMTRNTLKKKKVNDENNLT